jgi:hypothetical protein
MYVQNVRDRVEGIKVALYQHDEEMAHAKEDQLYEEVLRHYAAHPVAGQLAREALKSKQITFGRWCA